MSRSNKKTPETDDRDYSVSIDEIGNYSRDEAFKPYVPPTEEELKSRKKNEKTGYKKYGKKMGKGKKAALIILIILLALIIACVVAFFVLRGMGKKMMTHEKTDIRSEGYVEDDGKTVYYKGKIYKLNENVTSIACMGVDKEQLEAYGVSGTAGQNDTNVVLVIDTATGSATALNIPRDTMVDVDVYDVGGKRTGSEFEQICLAYAYGNGFDTSCDNAVRSIERALYGMPVSSYIALDIAGISVINDYVGGVVVTSPETIGPFKEGEKVTLNGRDAVTFVRTRSDDVAASLRRSERQMAYIRAFAYTAVSGAKKNPSTIKGLYDVTMNYCTTNVGLAKVTYLASSLLGSGFKGLETATLPGEMVMGEKYAEYHVDTEKGYEMILDLFYNEAGTYDENDPVYAPAAKDAA